MGKRTGIPDLQPLLALTALTVNVAVLDATGRIIGVNAAWQDFADANGLRLPNYGVGLSYLEYCGADRQGKVLRRDIQDLLDGEGDVVTATYPCHSPRQVRWYLLVGLPLSRAEPAGALLLHTNLTDVLPVVFSARDLRSATSHLSSSDSSVTLQRIADVVERSIADTMARALPSAAAATASASAGGFASAAAGHRHIEKAQLSARHRQVFAMLGEGKSNLDIAAALGVSQNTIKVHVSEILRRLGVRTRTQAALLASRASAHANHRRPPRKRPR